MAKVTANDVADYILWFARQHGDYVSNLKVQKLLYYVQAWHLALYDEPLFDDHFEAWVHGPVQPSVYARFKQYGWRPILDEPCLDGNSMPDLPEDVRAHVDEVMEEFLNYSAYMLERMTHNEVPWINARGGIPADEPSRNLIKNEDMRHYYKQFADAEA